MGEGGGGGHDVLNSETSNSEGMLVGGRGQVGEGGGKTRGIEN